MASVHKSACLLFVSLVGGVLILAGCGGPAHRAEGPYGRVELLRDRWGVPHVFAAGDEGAMYGLGYACAEDRAFQMYYNLRTIQGRLAELVGDVKVGVTRAQPEGKTSALRSDIEMRTIGYYLAAQQTARRLSPEGQRMLLAYSQGVNDYINSHRDKLLYLFKKYDLQPEPWTPADCIASWWRVGLFFSGDGLNEMAAYYEIKSGQRQVQSFPSEDYQGALKANRIPVRDDASVIQPGDVSEEWVRRVYDYAHQHNLSRKVDVTRMPQRPAPDGPRFSHAWVVGKTRTTDGSAVLVSDPQTLVRNPSLWYEFHIVGKTFNARGIGTPGSPNLLIGFTTNVAWGLTALGADQADLFLLKTDAAHPNQYSYDGQWLDMDARTETIQVKGGRPTTLTVRRTRLGPVVTSIAAGVHPGDEVALKRVPVCDPEHDTLEGLLAMMRAKDAMQFEQALGGWTFPSVNCLFGDHQGNIGFKTVLALPVRSAHSLLDDRAAHEGWDSANDWQGFVPHGLLPQVINPKQGWLVSANHRPIASFYPISMGISTGSLGDTDRSWRLKERVRAKDMFTSQDVLDIHYDTVAPVKRDMVKLGYHLRDVQKYALFPDTLKALEYLESWRAAGCRSELSIKGTEILDLMPMAFRQNFAAATTYGGGVSGLCNMLQTLDARIAADPKAELTADEADYINTMLQAAWRYGQSNYGNDPGQWNAKAHQALRSSKMPYMSTLDGFGSLDEAQDLTFPDLSCVDGGTIRSQKNQSYTQYVPMSDPDKAMALLPIGQSEQPNDPFRTSDYDLWSQSQLRPAPLSRRAVESITASRTALTPTGSTRVAE